jgi:hypothetical protein
MQRRFFDLSLAPIAAIADKYNFRMDGTADDKTTKEALQGYVTDLKGLIATAKDGATAVSAFNDALIKDNYNLRENKRELKEKLATSKLPDGARVLQKDEASEYDKFKALGFKPEDIPAIVTERDSLKVGQTSRDAAEALGWKFKPLQQLLADKKLNIEMRETEVEEEKDGKKEKVKKLMPFVIEGAGKDSKAIRLDEFEPLKDFHASLITDESAGTGAGGRTTQNGVRMPAQAGAGGAGTKGGKKGGEMSTHVTSVLDSRYRRPDTTNSGKGQIGSKK